MIPISRMKQTVKDIVEDVTGIKAYTMWCLTM